MKKHLSGIIPIALMLGSAALVLGTMTVHADDLTTANADIKDHGFYVSGDVGVSLASDLTSDLDDGEFTSLNAGVRADLTVGYAFKLSDHFLLAPELEAGVTYNSFGTGQDDGTPTSGGGDIVQVPILVNGVLTYKINERWSVYGGVGLGIAYTDVSTSNDNQLILLQGSDGGLAVDAKLGVQYRLGPGELGLGYKYMENAPLFLKTISNHTIEASYTIYF